MTAEGKDEIIDAGLAVIRISVHIWLLRCRYFESRKSKTLHLFYQKSSLLSAELLILYRKNECWEYAENLFSIPYVALDSGLNAILFHYNKIAQRLLPERKYFFYNKNIIEPFSAHDLRYQFEKRWNKVNSNHAVPYDLRHNYAVRNINRWIASGFEFHDKFLYLSKSMGHSNLESTKYYYSLVPKMAAIMHDCDNDSFNSLVPEVTGYEEE